MQSTEQPTGKSAGKPADLDAFWQATISELAQTDPNPQLSELPEQTHREFTSYTVTVDSFQGQRIRGWYSVPNDRVPGRRLPAILAVPGYGGAKPIPTHLPLAGYAVLTLFPRGQGESLQDWQVDPGATKLTHHLGDKERYYYRAAYMDCLRGVDFLAARDEVDASRIGMWSRSQGGGFTLATAALDSRITAAVAEEPFMCNYPESISITTSPYCELNDYVTAHPERRQQALDTLAYFDTLNLADRITCPILLDIGMKDETCPYRTIMPVFERITAPKSLCVYPELTHSACTDFNGHAIHWLGRYLGN
jgi:cephalosporin-C deacetylase